tara:strand:+ start:14651 stop:15520 length:870 start_codon:yes stop_codon:yes gene_type:complete
MAGLLIIGAGGFLGRAVLRFRNGRGEATAAASHQPGMDYTIDLSQPGGWDLPDSGAGIDAAFICSAVSSLDRCREDWAATHRFNVENTITLIDRLADLGIRPVFCSSDQVFRGDRGGYTERDTPDPQTAYGRQKQAVERHILDCHPAGVVMRMGKLFGPPAEDTSPIRQTIETLAMGQEVRAASDMWLTLTHVDDIAAAVSALLASRASGPWHVVAPGPLTRFDLAAQIAAAMGRVDLVREIRVADLALAEPRPPNTVLDGAKFHRACSLPFRDWPEELPEFLHFYGRE